MSNSKVLLIHRAYRNRGGEDAFLDDILKPALSVAGLEYETLLLPPLGGMSSMAANLLEIFGMFFGFEGLRPSFRTCLGVLERGGFSHVLFNNCLPTVSLKVFSAARSRGLRTFMWVHNFRLDCANGLHFDGKNICHQCLNAGSRWSFFQNCQRSWIQSFIYAFTYRGRRVARSVVPFIDHFICNSEFTRGSLRGALGRMGLECSSSVISMPIPLAVDDIGAGTGSSRVASLVSRLPQPFYLFLGRVSYDKGADIFLDFARRFPERGFVMCGEGPMLEEIRSASADDRVANFALAGVVNLEEKRWLFKNCEALIVASRSPETSSLVISESQSYGTPVVYPRGGGAEETFKLLGRNGCALDEFVGQKFVRGSSGARALSLEDFASSLKSGLTEFR